MASLLRAMVAVALIVSASAVVQAQSDARLQDLAGRARQAMEARRYDEAAGIYRDLIARVPENAGLRMNLGIALESGGHHREAVTELERVVREQPSLTPAWLMLGLAHLNLEQPAAAAAALERVTAAIPSNPVARLELGDAYLQLGRHEDAAAQFDALTGLDPKSPKAWIGVARSYTGIARAAFDRLDEQAPDSAFWSALLGRAKAAQQQYRTAFGLYRQALGRDPRIRGAHAGLAAVYRATGHGDWAAAEDDRERAQGAPDCTREPEACAFSTGRYHDLTRMPAATPRALYWKSLAASELALDAFTHLEALPPSPEIHEVRADANRLRGLHHAAITEWQAAVAARPNDTRLREELAREYWLNQDFETARPLLAELLRTHPDSAPLNRELGDTLVQLQQPEQAIPYLRKAVALDRTDVDSRVALARGLARAGQWKDAIPELEATVSTDRDGTLHRLLARAYAVAGRADESAAMAKKAEALAAAATERQGEANATEIAAPR